MIDEADVRALLQRRVDLHNRHVAAHGHACPASVWDGAEMDVEGAALSPLRRAAIVQAFQRHEIVLWKVGHIGDGVAFASYAWRDHPRLGGLLRIEREGSAIRRVTLRPGYSRIFGLLSSQLGGGPFSERGGHDAFAEAGATT
jgi:hypothetical protein